MKQVYSIAMLLAIFVQVAMKPAVMLRWKIDQETITVKYCENKDRPMLHCDGQCYLAKQLRKLESEEQKERAKHPFPGQKLKLVEIDLACPLLTVFGFSAPLQEDERTAFPAVPMQYRFDFNDNCFHPPQAG